MRGVNRVLARALFFLLLAVLGLPSGQAAVERTEDQVFSAVGDLSVRLEARFLDDHALQLRRLADQDRDGQVTAAESTVHLAVLRHEQLEGLADRLRLNADAPTFVENLTVDVVGLHGPVARPESVVFTGAALVSFEVPQALGDHVYVVRATDVPTRLSLRLPEGAQIRTVSGLVEEQVDQAHALVSGQLGEADALFMFSQSTWGDVPASRAAPTPWLGFVLAAVVGSAAARRFH